MDIYTTDLKSSVKIERSPGDNEPITTIELFNKAVRKTPDKVALAYKSDSDSWQKITYSEYKVNVEKIAKCFIKLGLSQKGVVAILAWNCPEWNIGALASIYAGGITTSIYTTSSPSACQHILADSQAEIVIVDDEEQQRKIEGIRENLPSLKFIIQIGNVENKQSFIIKWSDLLKMNVSDVSDEYEQRIEKIKPNDCCCILYTSGTTGMSKGAMLSHDNLTFDAQSIYENTLGNEEFVSEVFLSYLPLSHGAAFMEDIYMAIICSATVYFADVTALKSSLLQTLLDVRPTVFMAVPRIYEKIEQKLKEKFSLLSVYKQRMLSWSQSVTLHFHSTDNHSLIDYYKYKVACRFFHSKLKSALGFQRCRAFFCGSAPLSEETKRFFMSVDMALVECYGMTESSTVHTLVPRMTPTLKQTVGKALKFMQTKVIDVNAEGEGQICLKGRHVFMGYLNNLEKTRETIDNDGWLHTGDLGKIDEEGFVYITGRIKEMIITSGGENIPTIRIENLVKNECPAISNAFLVGDKRKYLTMLISLKTEIDSEGKPLDSLANETINWLKALGRSFTKLEELLNDPLVRSEVQKAIDRANAKAISNPQRIQKFALLANDFSVATGELTNTLKVKRSVVLEKYKEVINSMYDE